MSDGKNESVMWEECLRNQRKINKNEAGRVNIFPYVELLLDFINAYHRRLHFSIKATVNPDHLIGFYRSAIKDGKRNKRIDRAGFVTEDKLISSLILNEITS